MNRPPAPVAAVDVAVRAALLLVVLLLAVLLLTVPGPAAPAGAVTVAAQEEPAPTLVVPSTSTTVLEQELPGIIPKPNSGVAPTRPGERGGWAQLLLAGILVTAVVVVFVRVARAASRTTKAKQRQVR